MCNVYAGAHMVGKRGTNRKNTCMDSTHGPHDLGMGIDWHGVARYRAAVTSLCRVSPKFTRWPGLVISATIMQTAIPGSGNTH